MALQEGLKRHFAETVVAFAATGRNVVGGRLHSTSGTTYAARHEERFHQVVNVNGQMVTARGIIVVAESSTGGLPAIGINDKVTRTNGTILPLLAVETPISTARPGLYHQVLHY